MTKEVELIIKGFQKYADHEDADLKTETTGEYFYRNQCHYVLYEEQTEGFTQPVKSMLKLRKDQLEIVRRGLINTSMVFDRNRKTMTPYQTPFGEFVLGIHTKSMRVLESETQILVEVRYSLEADDVHMADCRIKIEIKQKAEE